MPSLATVRSAARSIARELRDPREIGKRALSLASAGEEQLAFEVFRAAPHAAVALSLREIETLLPSLHDWNSTDCFGCFVSGVAWRSGTLADASILRWTQAEGRWVRRAALVSTVPLNLPARGARSPRGEATKTLLICRGLVDDRNDMVVKAMSWALRTLAARNPEPVRRFLAENRHRLAARVLREVGNKLATGLKNPRGGAARRTRR